MPVATPERAIGSCLRLGILWSGIGLWIALVLVREKYADARKGTGDAVASDVACGSCTNPTVGSINAGDAGTVCKFLASAHQTSKNVSVYSRFPWCSAGNDCSGFLNQIPLNESKRGCCRGVIPFLMPF